MFMAVQAGRMGLMGRSPVLGATWGDMENSIVKYAGDVWFIWRTEHDIRRKDAVSVIASSWPVAGFVITSWGSLARIDPDTYREFLPEEVSDQP